MKHLVLTLILVPTLLFGQTSKLDQKNGFRSFKIGQNISAHKAKTIYQGTSINKDTKKYDVDEKITVLNYPATVDLVTYKDLIIGINVRFENITSASFDELLKALEDVYGPSYNSDYDTKKPDYLKNETTRLWNGKKLGMQFSYNSKLAKAVIGIWDMNSVTTNYESEF